MARLKLTFALLVCAVAPAAAASFHVAETDTVGAFAEALHVALDAVRPVEAPLAHVDAARRRISRLWRASPDAPPLDLRSIGRTDPWRALARDQGMDQDRDSLLWFYGSYLEDGITQHADTSMSHAVAHRVQNARRSRLEVAQREGLRRLWRYEVKYGPGSARLNLAEVMLNAGLQRMGLFNPGVNGPSPYEALLAYSTSYATLDDRESAQAVSVLEAGIRRYTFSWDPDAGFWAHLIKPRYGSLGVAIAEERDGALRWPLSHSGRTTRVGPFLTWGDLKVAMLLGPQSRFMVSRQVHLLPHVF